MVVTKKLTVDLARKTILGTVDAVRGDSAIALELTLLCDGVPWEVPSDASVIVRYCQGTAGGEYDTLPDGTAAYQAEGNVLTVRVAPEVCSAAGKTDFQVTVLKGADQISTFRMVVDVQSEVSGINQPGVYTNLAQWLRYNGADGQVMVSLELEDLRTATDGTVFQTAGEAVRSQLAALENEKVDKTDFTALQNRMEEVASAPCACEEQSIDLTGQLVNHYFVSWTGETIANSNERCTDFVPVLGGYRITLKNVLLIGNRSVCVYDENKKYIRYLKTGVTDTEVTLTLPLNAAYLRASVDPKKTPEFFYPDVLGSRLQIVDDRISDRITALDTRLARQICEVSPLAGSIDLTDKIIDGEFINWTGETCTLGTERCTDYVPIKGGYAVVLKNVNVKGNRSICAYDENKTYIRHLKASSEETEFTLTMPENAAYLRATIHSTSTPIIYYADIVDSSLTLLEKKISAKGYQTLSQVQALIDEAFTALPVYAGEVEDV